MENRISRVTLTLERSPWDVNMYLLDDGDSLTLVDAGYRPEESLPLLRKALDDLGYGPERIDRILVTHHHHDHTSLIRHLTERRKIPVYIHPSGIPHVLRDERVFRMRLEFRRRLYRESGCGDAGEPHLEAFRAQWEASRELAPPEDCIVPIREGDRIPGLESVRILETPGHSFDSVVFYDPRERWLFAGDLLIRDISTNALVEPDDEGRRRPVWEIYRRSLRRAAELEAEVVYSGHGEPFSGHRELIEHRLKRMIEKSDRVADLLAGRPMSPYEVARAIYAKALQNEFHLVMSEVNGMLDFLEAAGKVSKRMENGVWIYAANR